MGFFDRLKQVADTILGRKPATPPIEPDIMGAFEAPAKKPSLFERIKNVFTPKTTEPERVPSWAEMRTEEKLEQAKTEDLSDALKDFMESRKERIFQHRRNTDEEGRMFYRLTQHIWDRPGIPAADRDKAIREYYERKYGVSDMNKIYDRVLSENADDVERYKNAPNAMKYEVLKNIKVKTL